MSMKSPIYAIYVGSGAWLRTVPGTAVSHIYMGRLWKHVPGLKSPEESDLGVFDDADPGDS